MKVERSIEDINSLLFDHEESKSFDYKEHDGIESKSESRFLKQKELSLDLEQLEPVPYYKKPVVQALVVLMFALPIGWVLISAFGANSNSSTVIQPTSTKDRGKQLLEQSLKQEREKNQNLLIEKGLKAQRIAVIPAKPTKPSIPAQAVKSVRYPPPAVQTNPPPVVKSVTYAPVPVNSSFVPSSNSPKRIVSRPLLTQRKPTTKKPVPPVSENPAQWVAAANMGKYGETSLENFLEPEDSTDWQPTGGLGTAPSAYQFKAEGDRLTTDTIPNDSGDSETEAQNNYQPTNYSKLIIGTHATAKLETPLAWSGNIEQQTQKIIVRLTQPLLASDRSVAVPKDGLMVAEVDNATATGLIQMSVISALIDENGQTTEKPVSKDAILILGAKGNPLIAKAQNRSDASTNLETAILSGISSATGLINAPTSQSTFNSSGGFQTTVNNSQPNYLAGFGQGVAQSLVQQMQLRNQQSQQLMQLQPKVFVLEQDTPVQVFVNQSTAF